MADNLQVSLVAADREVWSGEASFVKAKTVEGEIGILAGHQPVLSVLTEGPVDIKTADSHWTAAVDGGFLSVANDQVRLVCQRAHMSAESNYDEARRLLHEQLEAEAQ
ncbi:MAG: F0F1 ATP synthase subunit epsilon [Myxococcales bacterium]|nr:MAG: F0F1 ATP synthase subunit epsilon [Myxococcales bacterium]